MSADQSTMYDYVAAGAGRSSLPLDLICAHAAPRRRRAIKTMPHYGDAAMLDEVWPMAHSRRSPARHAAHRRDTPIIAAAMLSGECYVALLCLIDGPKMPTLAAIIGAFGAMERRRKKRGPALGDCLSYLPWISR